MPKGKGIKGKKRRSHDFVFLLKEEEEEVCYLSTPAMARYDNSCFICVYLYLRYV
jgi:hypothetical protein